MLAKKIAVGFFIVFLSNYCLAEIYESVDKQGNVTYTDTSASNAQPVDLPALGRINSADQSMAASAEEPKDNSNSQPAAQQHVPYAQFDITSPANEDTLYNQHAIAVNFAVSPALQTGDKILVFVDNIKFVDSTSSSAVLNEVPRGQHTVYGELVDANNQVLMRSSSIVLNVRYTSVAQQGQQNSSTGNEANNSGNIDVLKPVNASQINKQPNFIPKI